MNNPPDQYDVTMLVLRIIRTSQLKTIAAVRKKIREHLPTATKEQVDTALIEIGKRG